MPTAVKSSFDVAFWFMDVALDHNEYLQPQKLHRLLFLSQAYFAVAFAGKKLMPATFVATDAGPIEPDLYRVFAKGRPDVDVDMHLPQRIEMFLDSIWRRFGHHSADYLGRLCKENMAYAGARKRAKNAEITFKSMYDAFAEPKDVPDLKQVIRPKVMRSHTGRPVAVTSWAPALKPAAAPPANRSPDKTKTN